MRAVLWVTLALTSGCLYRARLTSLPSPAAVQLGIVPEALDDALDEDEEAPEARLVQTPAIVDLRWAPFSHQWARVTAPGHRTIEVDLRNHGVHLWRLVFGWLRPAVWRGEPHGQIGFVLVPEHGPAGTWEAADIR